MYLKSVNADAADDDDDDDDDAGSNFVCKKIGEHWKICIAPSVEGHFQQVSNSIFIYMIVCLFICLFIHSFIHFFFFPKNNYNNKIVSAHLEVDIMLNILLIK